jgi:hypothetical protein
MLTSRDKRMINHDVFRPPISRRLVLMISWPSTLWGISLPVAALIAASYGGGYFALTAACASAYAIGLWRAWNIRVMISGNELTVVNPLRTYRINVDHKIGFLKDVIYVTFPPSIGIWVTVNRRRHPIVASGYLAKADRAQLSAHLNRLATITGARSQVPPQWESRW